MGKNSAGKALKVRQETESHPQNHLAKMASFSERLCLKRKGREDTLHEPSWETAPVHPHIHQKEGGRASNTQRCKNIIAKHGGISKTAVGLKLP